MEKRKVLFLCTGNSARSQMSEGLVNHFLGDHWRAFSAGTAPSGYVHPLAIAVMAELGIDISEHWSKFTGQFLGEDFDLVITVCDHAAKNCPTWLGRGKVVHMGFPDPAAAEGGNVAKKQVFRQVRDAIRKQVLEFVAAWENSEPQELKLEFMVQE